MSTALLNFFKQDPRLVFAAGAASVVLAPALVGFARQVGTQVYWKVISPGKMARVAKRKKAQLEEQLSTAEKYSATLSAEKRAKIDNQGELITGLLELQKQSEVSAEDILKFYLEKTVAAHRKTNCLSAMDVDLAIGQAKRLDAFLKDNNKELSGPLHGIPMSLKDCISTRTMDATIGVSGNCFASDNADSPLTTLLEKAGAVFVGKTNVPQTMLSFECFNAVFGHTTNPYSPNHTPGGSSGGEGALLALRGAPVGIGTDIGGSIRIPAHFCGIYGIKPSQWRIPIRGFRSPVKGQEGIPSVAGPMGNRLENVEYCFKAIMNAKPWQEDGTIFDIPFRQDLNTQGSTQKKMRIGWYVDDGILEASPACQRAVKIAVESLAAQGHVLVPLLNVNNVETMSRFYQCIAADGGQSVRKAIQDDAPSPHVHQALTIAFLPKWLTNVVSGVYKYGFGDKMYASWVRLFNGLEAREYYQLLNRRLENRSTFIKHFTDNELDAIIAPGLATPAPALMSTMKFTYGCAYTACLNANDLSVVTVPVTKVDPLLDQWTAEQNARRTARGNKFMQKQMSIVYQPEAMKGLPVGVQVVGTRMNEEFVLGVASQLNQALDASGKRN